jgi:hypothetical protein
MVALATREACRPVILIATLLCFGIAILLSIPTFISRSVLVILSPVSRPWWIGRHGYWHEPWIYHGRLGRHPGRHGALVGRIREWRGRLIGRGLHLLPIRHASGWGLCGWR